MKDARSPDDDRKTADAKWYEGSIDALPSRGVMKEATAQPRDDSAEEDI